MDRPPRESQSSQAGGPPSAIGARTTVVTTTPAPAPASDQSSRTTSSQATSTLTSALQGPHPGPANTTDPRAAQAPNTAVASHLPPAANARPKIHRNHTAAASSGRLHARVPSSSKALKHNAAPSAKVAPRRPHPDEQPTIYTASRYTHRRAHSDVKLVRDRSTANLKRNQSHNDFARRNRSFDKLRAAGQLPIPSSGKGGRREDEEVVEDDDDDDEWVDDSLSASTYQRTPRELQPQQPPPVAATAPVPEEAPKPPPAMSSAEREMAQQHKEYLTSRLLRRIPSQNAPPQMSPTMALAPRSSHRLSPDNLSQESTAPATPNHGSGGEEDGADGLTSRFLTRPGSTFGREGSFYTHGAPLNAGHSLDAEVLSRKHRSMVDLSREGPGPPRAASDEGAEDSEQRRSSRRRRAAPAEISRTQQKLNLQRASSGIEPQPSLAATAASSGMGSEATLVNVSTPGHDGTVGRGDPRLPRLAEKTGMEYRVVRRYQNPLLRSVARLESVPGWDAQRKIPGGAGHVRNSSLPPFRDGVGGAGGGGGAGHPTGSRPGTPMRPQSSRTVTRNGLMGRESMGPRRNGDESVVAALRNLWEKPLDLSASH